jgi:hypothetical protein
MIEYYFPPEIFNIIKKYLFIDYNIIKEDFGSSAISRFDRQLYNDFSQYLPIRQTKILYNKVVNKDYLDYISDCTFIETKELTGNDEFIIYYSNIIHCKCNYGNHGDDVFLFKNLRFEDESVIKYIENIKFGINNSILCDFNGCFYKTLQKFYKMKGIPIHIFIYGFLQKFYTCYPKLTITFYEKPQNIKILYDVYKRKKPRCNIGQQFYTYQCHNQINIKVKKENNKINLKEFRCPVYFFICNHKLTNIKLHLFDQIYPLQQYGQIIRLTNKIDHEILSNYPYNISRIIADLIFDSPYSDNIILTSVNLNIIRSMSGCYGMAYV